MQRDRKREWMTAATVALGLVFAFGTRVALRAADAPALSARPPVAVREPHVDDRLGIKVVDEYSWLSKRDDPRVKAYLEAENSYTAAQLRDTEELQERLFREMLARIQETDVSVPDRIDGYEYYTRTVAGKPYKIHYRKPRPSTGTTGPEQMLVDENAMAEGHENFQLGTLRVSPDQNLLAYSVDFDGSEEFTLRFRDLRTGNDLDESIAEIDASAEWAADNRTLFYIRLDEAHRPYRVYRHELGSDPKNDPLVYEEKDESFFVELYKSKSRRFLVIQVESQTTTENSVLEAGDPRGTWRVVRPRKPGVEYRVEHRGDEFFVLTNDGAKNFKIARAPVSDPSPEHWKDFLPHRPEVKVEELAVFADQMAVLERERGLTGIRVVDFATGQDHRIEFAEPAYTVGLERNPEFTSRTLRFSYTSLTTPLSIFDYNAQTRQRERRKQEEVLGGYDPSRYVSERIWATAKDGTQIPISLLYRKGQPRDGRSPLLLEGYGAYGISFDPEFESQRLSLVDRGFVYAIAHVRGGGDMGRPWYDDGKLLRKRNTFTDFIACAEHLTAQRYTSAERLAIRGGSAGGLLIGAVVNMRPDLFRAAVADVPFVDLINTMSDPSIPLTVTEWEEWGDPRRQPDFDTMRAYSPYDNIRPQAYPGLLVTAGWNDPRVGYWEPAKWVARLRATKTNDRTLLLKTNMGAGHAGASGRYGVLKDLALEDAFLLKELGLADAKK